MVESAGCGVDDVSTGGWLDDVRVEQCLRCKQENDQPDDMYCSRCAEAVAQA